MGVSLGDSDQGLEKANKERDHVESQDRFCTGDSILASTRVSTPAQRLQLDEISLLKPCVVGAASHATIPRNYGTWVITLVRKTWWNVVVFVDTCFEPNPDRPGADHTPTINSPVPRTMTKK